MKTTNEIRNEFIATYSPAALNALNDDQLARLLFADKKAGKAFGTRGMFTWIEFGDPENEIPVGSLGSCGVVARYGVWLDVKGKYIHHDPSAGKHGISDAEAKQAARTTREVITKICDEVKNAALDTVDGYRELDKKISKICSVKDNWYWSKKGNLYIYLIKYLRILYPDKIAECFSDSKIGDKLSAYGRVVPKSKNRLLKNGIVSLCERGLI